MENNPEAVQDTKQVVYREPTITRQPLVGGGGVYESTKAPDLEAGPQDTLNTSGSAPQVATIQVRQAVQPSPTNAQRTTVVKQENRRSSGGGWLGSFATRSRGRYFFPLHAGIVFFSFLVLVSAALWENNTLNSTTDRFVQYQLLVGQLSFAVSLGACVMERLGFLEHPNVRVALSAFQVFFWVPSLAIITFFGTFVSPVTNANGFFGVWGATACAAIVFSHETERFRRDPRNSSAPRTSLLLLFFFSLVIMGAGIRLYYSAQSVPGGFDLPQNAPRSYTIFSIAFGAITAFLSLIMLLVLDTIPAALLVSLSTILWLWVAVGVLILTFADPFEEALGNGYYASLFALVASFGLLISLRKAQHGRNTSGNAHQHNRNASASDERESSSGAAFFTMVRGGALASLVVMVAAILACNARGGCPTNGYRWQIAAGAVSLGLALIVIATEAFNFFRMSSIFKLAFSFIWLVWWIAAFITLTFFGTFQSPTFGRPPGSTTTTQSNPIGGIYANGFFFTWIALIFAALAFAEALKERARASDPPSPTVAKSGFLLLIIVGSAITLGAGIDWYYATNYSRLSKYAISLGAISIGLCLVLWLILTMFRHNFERHDSIYNAGLYLLTVWWAVGALVLTFGGLWTSATDNGYFSVFFTLGACLLALSGIWRTDDDDDDAHQYRHGDDNGGNTTGRAYHASSDPRSLPQQQQPYTTATATTTVNRY